MINNVTLVGRLTKDPELKYTPSNVAQAGRAIRRMVQERQSGPV